MCFVVKRMFSHSLFKGDERSKNKEVGTKNKKICYYHSRTVRGQSSSSREQQVDPEFVHVDQFLSKVLQFRRGRSDVFFPEILVFECWALFHPDPILIALSESWSGRYHIRKPTIISNFRERDCSIFRDSRQ